MNTPEPIIIAGQPMVIGRVVHLPVTNIAGTRRCVPCVVLRTNQHGEALIQSLAQDTFRDCVAQPEVRMPVALDAPFTTGRWHWPNADDRRCQGRE